MMDMLFDFSQLFVLEQRIGRLADSLLETPKKVAEAFGVKTVAIAKEMVGEYQTDMPTSPVGESYPSWAELHESTKKDRVRLGYTENDPLLRRGDGRESIASSEPEDIGVGVVEVVIGYSTYANIRGALQMMWHEVGTVNMEPRPVIGPAAMRAAEDFGDWMGPFYMNHFNVLRNDGNMGVYAPLFKN